MKYVVLGIDQETFDLAVVTRCDGFSVSESVPLDGIGLPDDAPTYGDYEKAATVADTAIRMDRTWWPPISPVMAEVDDGRVCKLLASGDIAEDIAAAGKRWDLPVELVP